jgi:transcriptional regulator with XRE-family HTH domain
MNPAEFKEARQSLGLDQRQAADLLGYGNAVRISEIEVGKRNPSASVLRLLAAYVDGYRPADWPSPRSPHPRD